MTDRTFSRIVGVLGVALIVALLCAVAWSIVDSRRVERRTIIDIRQSELRTCDRLNQMGLAEQSLWRDPLSVAPPALPPHPTPAEVRTHDAALALRANFAANLHKFDPIKCSTPK